MPEQIKPNRYLIVAGGTGKGLLGKRAALNFIHEFQIDVESERFDSKDTAHFDFIALDTYVGTTHFLAQHYQRTTNTRAYAHTSPYLTTRIDSQAVKNHGSVYWKNVAGAMLAYGLAQEPAVGSSTARYPDNETNLRAKLARIKDDAGRDKHIEVWIVSSTAGGTGQGIHRYIAALVADILAVGTPTPVHFHFVQIGQETYGTAGDKCTTNTFLGVAADIAFSFLVKNINDLAVTAWYYLDLNDVGTGNSAKILRAELVEMSIKTIMNQNVADDLNKLVINNNGLPIVLARTGFWGKDFDETSKYKQTLGAVADKLKHMLMPAEDMPARAALLLNAAQTADRPVFNETQKYSDAINRAQNNKAVEQWLTTDNTKFPAYAATGAPGATVDLWSQTLRTLATDLVSDWTRAFKAMGITVDELGTSYSFIYTKDSVSTKQDLRCRKISGSDKCNKDWESGVDQASIAKLWCHYLLEGFSTVDESPALLAVFMGLAQKAAAVNKNWLTSTQTKSVNLAGILGKLLAALVKIVVLQRARKEIQTHLDEALRSAAQTADFTAKTLTSLDATTDTQPTVLAAALSEILNQVSGETWLSTMHRPVELNDARAFRTAVLAGATGLTKNGLIEVLDLPATADVTEIAAELVKEPAEVTVGGGIAGAKQVAPIYWQRTAPPGVTKEYFYRLLPQVDDATQAALTALNKEASNLFAKNALTVSFESLGRIGLYVMAFHGISLSKRGGGDYYSAPYHMLGGMRKFVQNELNRWEDDPTRLGAGPTGNYNVAAAGAIGEPLDLTALIAAGLTEADLTKLATYYLIHSNTHPTDPILDGAAAVLAERTRLLNIPGFG